MAYAEYIQDASADLSMIIDACADWLSQWIPTLTDVTQQCLKLDIEDCRTEAIALKSCASELLQCESIAKPAYKDFKNKYGNHHAYFNHLCQECDRVRMPLDTNPARDVVSSD